ncbi:hypothetical protein WJX77_000791 [Trebouxia sp. C0004]
MYGSGPVKAEDDEEDLYAMIYGEDAPKAPAKPVSPPPVLQGDKQLQLSCPEAANGQPSSLPQQAHQQQQQRFQYNTPQQQAYQQQAEHVTQAKPKEDDDDDFDIQLDIPQPVAQFRPEADDDDLDIQLDEPVAGLPLSIAQRSSSNQLHTATRQSSSGALPQGAQPPVPGPRPPPGAPSGPPQAALNPRPGVAPPRPPPGPPPPGHPAAVLAPPPMPGQWPRPQFVHTGAGASNLPRDEGNAVLPSQAGEHQLIRLPGQTRVSPEEYKEFLGLGHGDVFDLDPDRVVQAPWRMPGADPADFFNYGLNINTWKEYVGRIHQFRLEFSMQKKIQTYESSNDTPALDPDLPPELAAAVAQGRQGMTNAGAGAPSTSQSSRPFPPHRPPAPPPKVPPKQDTGSAIALTGDSDDAIALTGGTPSSTDERAPGTTAADDKAAAEAVSAEGGQIAQAKAPQGPSAGKSGIAMNGLQGGANPPPSGPPPSSGPAASRPPPSGPSPSPPNPGMGPGSGPPSSRAPPSGPGFIRPPSGMRPIEGNLDNMNGNLHMSMGMSGPMGFPPFRPGFPPMGPYPMMPTGPYPMMHGMPGPMMMGSGPMRGGPMGPGPMGQFMPDFGRENFREFGERPFMGGPHMFEEDEQGRQGFRQDDSGSGDALAMGMDVDIPAATTSGDRREAERRRGREGRYEQDEWRRSSHRDFDRQPEEEHWSRHRRRDWEREEDEDRGRDRSRDRDRSSHHDSWHDRSEGYDGHSRYR